MKKKGQIMKRLVMSVIMLLAAIAFTQAQQTIPGSNSQPLYGVRHFVSLTGNDTLAIWHSEDSTFFQSTDPVTWYNSIRVDKLAIGSITNPAERLDVSGKIALDGTQVAYRPTAFTGTLILGDGGGSLDTGADYNTFVGIGAGQNNTTGSYNTANGYQAGRYFTGSSALTRPNSSIFLGYNTMALADSGTNEIVIGYNAVGVGSNSVVLGNDSIATTVLKGNVGIGTTNPTKKLDVNGDIRSTNIEIGGDVFFKGLTRSTKNDVVFFDENDGKLYYDSGESIGTDDQTLAIDSLNRVFDISLENGNTVSFQDTFTDADADATNELQSISGSGFDLSTNDLTIGIENGLNETVDLSALDNSGTDDQSISGSGFNTLTNDLTIGIENGLNETVDLSALDNSGTDDQTLAIDSLNRVFDISLENGNTVSFQDTFTDADADATNELQSISQTGDVINISDDPSSVDLSHYLDNTDDQSISGSGFDLSTNDLTIGIEDGLNETVNLSVLDNPGTDDQSISGSGFNTLTNDLTIGIENGLNETVDLSALDNSGSWTWNGYSIDNSTSINTLGGNGLTVNTFSETSNSVTTTYELGTPSTITGSTTNGTTSSSHTHDLDFAIDDATDTDIEGQSGPPLAIGQILKWDGQNWINDSAYIEVNDMILSSHYYTAQNTFQRIYETDITASQEIGTTYEIDISGGWEFDGNADVEIIWYNLDQAGFATIASFNLIGSSNPPVAFDANIKVTLRNDELGRVRTYTYLDWKDQVGNIWMYRHYGSVLDNLAGAGESIELRVKVHQVDGYIAVEQGETKILK